MFLVGSCHEEKSGGSSQQARGLKRGGAEMDADQEVGCGVERTEPGDQEVERGASLVMAGRSVREEGRVPAGFYFKTGGLRHQRR